MHLIFLNLFRFFSYQYGEDVAGRFALHIDAVDLDDLVAHVN